MPTDKPRATKREVLRLARVLGVKVWTEEDCPTLGRVYAAAPPGRVFAASGHHEIFKSYVVAPGVGIDEAWGELLGGMSEGVVECPDPDCNCD